MAIEGLAQLAQARGVSLRRAQQLALSGAIDARRIGRVWVVDDKVLGYAAPRRSRPLSERSIELLAAVLEGARPEGLPAETSRARARARALREDEDPASLLRAWLPSRQLRMESYAANSRDLQKLAADNRIALSGVSDGRAGLSSGREVEAYVWEADLPQVRADWLLVPSDAPNVRLHVVRRPVPRPLPRLYLLADLADWDGPRERGRIVELLAEAH